LVYSNVGDYRKGADMRRSYLKVIVFVIVLVLVGVACELSSPADPTATVEIALPQEEPPIQEPVEPEPTDPPPLPTVTEEPMAEPTEEPAEEPTAEPPEEPTPQLETPEVADEPPAFFTEDFEDFDERGWSIEKFGEGWDQSSLYTDQGSLIVDLQGRFQEASFLYSEYIYSDVRMDISIHNRGANTSYVNFTCNYSDRFGWYDISISTGGEYKIWVYSFIDEDWDLIAQGGSTNIRTGRNENTYTVICQGNKITLQINGNVERVFEDRKYNLTEGMVGFSIYSENVVPVVVDVDYFSIKVP
jgi:hypothetical protein